MDKVANVVLITGGGGYLGTALASDLLQHGFSIVLADIQFNERAQQLAASSAQVRLEFMDLTNRSTLKDKLADFEPDYIFHLAALLDRTRDFQVFDRLYQVNVLGTYHLLEALNDVDYKAFCYASTSEVYGIKNQPPFHEDMVPDPVSPYSLTKYMAEKVVSTWSGLNEKPWITCRIFNFFGPYMPPDTFIPQLLQGLGTGQSFHMTGGEQKRDYLYIDDLVWYMKSLAFGQLKNQVVNICSGTSVSMKEIATWVKDARPDDVDIKFDLPYRKNELWEIRGSNDLIVSNFPGYTTTSFKDKLTQYLSMLP
ncbi:MAG: SDR family NAD(P)-dependent oxidoreductase [Lentimicrobiaceae bacterium]|nr:SDR family NAD(P)-dependent oxidoreductase [Lentimicrobiaceae bacterium]